MRRSDPWINNFNEYLIAACRSNMDIKFIWSGNDAKALVYYITDYVTKMSLSFHDTFSLVQKGIASFQNAPQQTSSESAIEKSRKLVLRCYNTLASQQELSGVQVASYLMNWGDHYTTHKFQGLFLIQTERYLQTELDEIRSKGKSKPPVYGKCIKPFISSSKSTNHQRNDHLFVLRERILFASNRLVHRSIDANKCNSFVQICCALHRGDLLLLSKMQLAYSHYQSSCGVELAKSSECYFEVMRERKQC